MDILYIILDPILLIMLFSYYSIKKNGKELNKTLRSIIKKKIDLLDDGKVSKIEKKLYYYYINYIPEKYRYIDNEMGIENVLPLWLEKILPWIFSVKILLPLICLYIIIPLFFLLHPIYIKNDIDFNINDIINNYDDLYKYILSSNGSITLYYASKIVKNRDNDIKLIQGNLLLGTKLLDQYGTIGFKYLNTSNLLLFLKQWQLLNNGSQYCFCPLFIGILNPNIYFFYNKTIDNWSIIVNFTTNNDLWTMDKSTTTLVTYRSKELQELNSLFTKNKLIKHNNYISIKYYNITKEEEEEEKETIFNINETICFIHCTRINT